jgi:hypothetical protein
VPLASLAVAVVAFVGAAYTTQAQRWSQREEREATADRALTQARREAYGRYLVAQHAIAGLLWAVEGDAQAVHDLDREPERRAEIGDKALARHFEARAAAADPRYDESGFAEMHASLLAGPAVADAIVAFELYINTILVERLIGREDGVEPTISGWHADWEHERGLLIRCMRREQQGEAADPRPSP